VNTQTNGHHPDLAGRDGGTALAGLYDAHARDLHRYLARRLDPATADDLVAETFLVAWQQRHRYQPRLGTARAWLYGIATNMLRRHARGEARAWQAMAREGGRRADSPDAPDTVAADRADAGAQARRLAGVLAGLRAEEREVLLLVAWAGLAPVEVAQALDLKVATVRTRLHRARTALRGCLTKEDNHG
jgi:RNA polymerase sigma-70 factor (ECF subfamily)